LERAWRAVIDVGSTTLLLCGEPGVGKTRLAAEWARRAHAEGALVLYGRCESELSVPFQPFAEALGWYCEHVEDARFGRSPGELLRLNNRVGARVAQTASSEAGDPETAQYRLFEAVVSWLSEVAEDQPTLLVLDDLHWATRPTLLLLRFLIDRVGNSPLFVIATYRDTDLDRQHPLVQVLPDLRRLPNAERMVLRGLDESGVVALLERVGEQPADAQLHRLAAALVAETEGNPLFVGEVLRDLVESGALVRQDGRWAAASDLVDLELPEGVRAVIGQRLASWRIGQHSASDRSIARA
jgi:predicted ATPase